MRDKLIKFWKILGYPSKEYSAYCAKFIGYFFIFMVFAGSVLLAIGFASNSSIKDILFLFPLLFLASAPLLLLGVILSSIDAKKSIEDYRTRKMMDDVYEKKVQKKRS